MHRALSRTPRSYLHHRPTSPFDRIASVVGRVQSSSLRRFVFDHVPPGDFSFVSIYQRSTAEAQAQADSLAEARRSRRQRKLDRIEIPEDHVSITNEMLGKGGFGVVYLADFNGHNAAAKV